VKFCFTFAFLSLRAASPAYLAVIVGQALVPQGLYPYSKTPYLPKQFNPSFSVLLYIIEGHCADFMGAGDLLRFGVDVSCAVVTPSVQTSL
jgi:hypothetical protein